MAKIRDRKSSSSPEDLPLSAAELLKFEKSSLDQMKSLKWPTKLAFWKDKIAAATRSIDVKSQLDTMVSFEAANPRSKPKSIIMHHVDLGAQIVLGDQPQATYFFAIGEMDKNDKRKLLRKIHFDLDESRYSSELKPHRHIQFAGGPCPPLIQKGYKTEDFEHLLPDMEKPRIPCLPQSFAILLHTALLEYHCTDAKIAAFIKSPEWLSVVTEAERRVIGPYIKKAVNLVTSSSQNKLSLVSSFYGLT